jgi:1,2-phenylacetyl-CoA epoxidase PaaB subunit
MEEITYDVFARKNRGEPLHHVGYLNALDDELARIYAWKTYDEESWFEMCVIRRANIIPVNRQTGGPAQVRRPRTVEAIPRIPAGQPYGGES